MEGLDQYQQSGVSMYRSVPFTEPFHVHNGWHAMGSASNCPFVRTRRMFLERRCKLYKRRWLPQNDNQYGVHKAYSGPQTRNLELHVVSLTATIHRTVALALYGAVVFPFWLLVWVPGQISMYCTIRSSRYTVQITQPTSQQFSLSRSSSAL